MKLIALSFGLLFSALSYGHSCKRQVFRDYVDARGQFTDHTLRPDVGLIPKNTKEIIYYGFKVPLGKQSGYDKDLLMFVGWVREYYGLNHDLLLVDPSTCKTIRRIKASTDDSPG